MRRILFAALGAALVTGLCVLVLGTSDAEATVTTTTSTITYGPGSATYSVPFKFLDQGDLLVVKTTDATGASTTLALTTDYTVSGAGSASGGSITLVAGALASGYHLVISRVVAYTQPTKFRAQGQFVPGTHEDAFDRTEMQIQQLRDAINNIQSDGGSGYALDLLNTENTWTAKQTIAPLTSSRDALVVTGNGNGKSGLVATSTGVPAGFGVTATGSGIGYGINAFSGTGSGSIGVVGSGLGTNGHGVQGTGSGTGTGVIAAGDPAGTGPGLTATAGGGVSPTRGSVHLTDQFGPSAPTNGDFWFNSPYQYARSNGVTEMVVTSVGRCSVHKYTGADLGVKLTAALADTGCTSRIYDATGMGGSNSLSADVTVSVNGALILLPYGTLTMGTNRIVVPVGVTNVAIVGNGAWGTQEGGLSNRGTLLSYSGTDAAIKVGDNTADTSGFRASDVAIVLGAGNNASGFQLNRATVYDLTRVRVGGGAGTGQRMIDLEGYTNFTGGMVSNSWLSVPANGSGIYSGLNANANTFIGVQMAGVVGSSVGYDSGGAGHGGNTIIGGDIENMAKAINLVNGSHWNGWGVRTEGCTKLFVDDAGSGYNSMQFTSTGVSSANTTIAGVNDSVYSAYMWQVRPDSSATAGYQVKLKNTEDKATTVTLQAGNASEQNIEIDFASIASAAGSIYRNSSGTFAMAYNGTPFVSRSSAGVVGIDAAGANQVAVNAGTNAGTGGFQVWSGGGAPTLQASISSAGLATVNKLAIASTAFASLGTPSNGSIYYCADCAIGTNPCVGSGTGAVAERLNGVWVCGEGNTFTGSGSGAGVSATGGSTSGTGVAGVGGAPNGIGGAFSGTGSGVAIQATGTGRILLGLDTFANIAASGTTNGTVFYCNDCTQTTPCAGGGTGALAQRINGAWNCAAGAGTEHDYSAFSSGNLAGGTAISQTIVTNASTLTGSSSMTHNVAGAGTGTFVAKLCSDNVTCGAGNVYLTCTAGANCATAAAGRIDLCTVTKAAVAAGTTLTWSVGTACGTTDPAVNLIAHMTTP